MIVDFEVIKSDSAAAGSLSSVVAHHQQNSPLACDTEVMSEARTKRSSSCT